MSDSGSWSRVQTLGHLGDAQQASGDRDLARAAWRQALALLDDLRHPDAAIFRAKLRDPA